MTISSATGIMINLISILYQNTNTQAYVSKPGIEGHF